MPDIPGSSFKQAEVVDLYLNRPPYAPDVYERILEFSNSRDCLVDIGCGEGKIARPMTKSFDQVTAIDPSARMIKLGKSLENGMAQNLTWIEATAEDAQLPPNADVATFASSIHWMNPKTLFPKLKTALKPNHIIAVVRGDEPFEPAWHDDWRKFLAHWVPEISGQKLDSRQWLQSRSAYLEFVDLIHQDDYISKPFTQSVEDFIRCQNSRETFAISKLGSKRAQWENELHLLLQPYANDNGELSFTVKTRLTIARLSV